MNSPLFDCPKHGKQPCVVTCVHVIAGSPPFFSRHATQATNGIALCQDCTELSLSSIEAEKRLGVTCSECFYELAQRHIARLQNEVIRLEYGRCPN